MTTTTTSKNNWFYEQNKCPAHASLFLVNFLSTARPRRETSQCDVLWRTRTYDNKFSFLYLNMDKVIKNLTPGKLAYIWRNVPFHVWKDAIFLVMFWLPSSSLLPNSHPTTVFCKISVRRTKYCLEFSITWGGQKKFLDVINSLQFSEQLIFHISLPKLGYFS